MTKQAASWLVERMMVVHSVVEALAYAVGFRVFMHQRHKMAAGAFDALDSTVSVAVGAVLGAAIGAKMSYWLADPVVAFADFPSMRQLLAGKSIIGALLGGLVGVELVKRVAGLTRSTGDAFVLPLTIGMSIGRVGCFLEGLADHTHGLPTALPWAVDYGDGVPRHPTQVYEIAFLLAQWSLLRWRRPAFVRPGDMFRAFLCGYLLFRLVVDFLKPTLYVWPGGMSGLQWLCIAGLAYHLGDARRLLAAATGGGRQA